MKISTVVRTLSPSQFAVVLLASAISVPVVAQQSADQSQSAPPAATQPSSPSSATNVDREGFWGRVNPFARKKWVKKRLDPINDRLTELDEVNAKNAQQIKDVDARAQAGIHQAQSAADAANQTATAAGQQAQNASNVAQGASSHVDQLNTTVSGLDQYHQVSDLDIPFHRGAMLSKDAKGQLDGMAANLAGHQGYILEIEARSPGAGSVGIQNSQRLAESVERYMVTEHQIPVYRMHFVALGNAPMEAQGGDDNGGKPARVRTSSVHVRLMENSLAAQDSTSPHGVASTTGAERP
ncbi:MAG TPA: flagellar motor protein MotB [Terriglobia bacterium]|nr:flagellar motor protein MotB [Terriglobia bacterium]